MADLKRGLTLLAAVVASLLGASASQERTPAPAGHLAEVVVGLQGPPLARAVAQRTLFGATRHGGRLNLRSPASVSYIRRLAAEQARVETAVTRAIPGAHVRWRYRIVANALAVVVPADRAARLSSLPGVARVYPTLRYHALLDRSPSVIDAPAVWGPTLATAGNGVKIAIVDDGIDQRHRFFAPAGFSMPTGFPKGKTAFTSAKVIVARAFAPPTPTWKYAARPFDPLYSVHGTHVAGIAAGDNGVHARPRRGPLSGIAPMAYLGNYKVLTIPTPSVGLDGNSPEIAAGIEAAVRDGMDVINLSLGEPEIEPARDLVVAAIEGAVNAGVVVSVAAGNDFEDFGRGSVGSPGTAPDAITAAAVSKNAIVSDFSSAGPTPISLRMKPDVAAPGEGILSSVPTAFGTWDSFSGTSMAAPHVAGAAAVLRQRHPTWTVAQIKSALVLTGGAVLGTESRHEAPTTREGGGLIDLLRADNPLVFAAPTTLSFGFLHRATTRTKTIALSDAGGGAGPWSVTVSRQQGAAGVRIETASAISVPGRLQIVARATRGAAEGDVTGFVVLQRGADRRRIPYWLRVTVPQLRREPYIVLRRPGTYSGNTAGKPSLVSTYRYPDDAAAEGLYARLRGPEQVFRIRLSRRVTNFGVVVLSHGRGVVLEPRIVAAGDENRLGGYAALPVVLNPYLESYDLYEPTAGVLEAPPGAYDAVFDSVSPASAGRFTFRFWINDVTPPRVRVFGGQVRQGRLRAVITDRGSGVDPRSLIARVDGRRRRISYSAWTGRGTIAIGRLARGRHSLVIQASDYQEAKNMENVGRILPNTRRFTTTLVVR